MIDVIITLSVPEPADVADVAAAVALALRADDPLPDGARIHAIRVEEQDA